MDPNNSNVPGMMYPTQKGMLDGNPRTSAMASMTNANQLQAQANKAMAGGKYKKKRGGAGAITVPQYQMLYSPQGGTGTNPNDQIQGGLKISTQSQANAAFDQAAFKKGGSRRNKTAKKGGNSNWNWGCNSGGKRSKKLRKSKRSKKVKKSKKK